MRSGFPAVVLPFVLIGLPISLLGQAGEILILEPASAQSGCTVAATGIQFKGDPLTSMQWPLPPCTQEILPSYAADKLYYMAQNAVYVADPATGAYTKIADTSAPPTNARIATDGSVLIWLEGSKLVSINLANNQPAVPGGISIPATPFQLFLGPTVSSPVAVVLASGATAGESVILGFNALTGASMFTQRVPGLTAAWALPDRELVVSGPGGTAARLRPRPAEYAVTPLRIAATDEVQFPVLRFPNDHMVAKVRSADGQTSLEEFDELGASTGKVDTPNFADCAPVAPYVIDCWQSNNHARFGVSPLVEQSGQYQAAVVAFSNEYLYAKTLYAIRNNNLFRTNAANPTFSGGIAIPAGTYTMKSIHGCSNDPLVSMNPFGDNQTLGSGQISWDFGLRPTDQSGFILCQAAIQQVSADDPGATVTQLGPDIALVKAPPAAKDFIVTVNAAGSPFNFQFKGGSATAPVINSTTDGAAFLPGVIGSNQAFGTLFGSNFLTAPANWTIPGTSLPPLLDGTGVTIDGTPVFPSYGNPNQINFKMNSIAQGWRDITVTTPQGTSNPWTVYVAPFNPAFFANGKYVAAVSVDSKYIVPPSATSSSARPAKPDEVLQIYGTAFGDTTPSLAPDQLVTSAAQLAGTVKVTINSVQASVQYAGVVLAGLVQLNVVVPPGTPDGDNPISASIDGYQTQSGLFLPVQH